MTYKDIEKKYGISYSILTDRVRFLGIKGRFKDKKVVFNREQVDDIVNYSSRRQNKKTSNDNHSRKFKIIEFYLKGRSGRKVAEFLNMNRKVVYAAIKEYNETGCIIVESKLNNK